jgi:uridine phosphorylase
VARCGVRPARRGPGRVAKVASRWETVELNRSNREITTATGTYQGCASRHVHRDGTDNVEIVLAELMEITDRPTLIRIGSSGALQPEITSAT